MPYVGHSASVNMPVSMNMYHSRTSYTHSKTFKPCRTGSCCPLHSVVTRLPLSPNDRTYGVMTECLANVLVEHYSAEPNRLITNREVVDRVRQAVAKKGHKTQNPCLECTEDMAGRPFLVY